MSKRSVKLKTVKMIIWKLTELHVSAVSGNCLSALCKLHCSWDFGQGWESGSLKTKQSRSPSANSTCFMQSKYGTNPPHMLCFGHQTDHMSCSDSLQDISRWAEIRAEPIISSATRFGRVSATRQYSVVRTLPKPSSKNFLSLISRNRNDDYHAGLTR